MEKFILVVLVGGILGIGPPPPPSYFMAPVEDGFNQVYHAIGKLSIYDCCWFGKTWYMHGYFLFSVFIFKLRVLRWGVVLSSLFLYYSSPLAYLMVGGNNEAGRALWDGMVERDPDAYVIHGPASERLLRGIYGRWLAGLALSSPPPCMHRYPLLSLWHPTTW